ncbi:MFS transporter [Oceanibacterium hippocampi]|uniref:Putative MFS-type transporter YcaD n=1 Tax=Oceanibacterium hippocampi TaxID=745714 RepID=A0A1Y5SPZ6_9PROT|nr:MFS transporter [Oceanibacterium hippocampi]SLN43993.1 putative MFS-type transporter YcaD [Oceanibacterium hippocampi]
MADSATPAPGGSPRQIVPVIAMMMTMALSYGISIPLVSFVLESRGYSSGLIGLLAATPSVALFAIAPFVARLVRIVGARPLAWISLLTVAASVGLLPVLDNLPCWFLLRIAMGVADGILFSVSESWINMLAGDARRGRVLAIYTSVMAAGFAIGPALLGLVGTEGWLPFAVATGIILTGLLPLSLTGPGLPDLDGTASHGLMGFVARAPTLSLAVLLTGYVDAVLISLLPVYGLRSGLSASASALMITVGALGSLLLQYPIGWLADHVDRQKVFLGCGVGLVAGALLLPFVAGKSILLWPMLLLWCGACFGLYTVAMTLLGQRFTGPELVVGNAAFAALWGIGGITGPVIAGEAMDRFGKEGMPGTLAAGGLVFLAIGLWRHHRRKPTSSA